MRNLPGEIRLLQSPTAITETRFQLTERANCSCNVLGYKKSINSKIGFVLCISSIHLTALSVALFAAGQRKEAAVRAVCAG